VLCANVYLVPLHLRLKSSIERSLVMNDKNYILITKDDVRKLVEIPVKGRIEAIGFTRYTEFSSIGRSDKELVANGTYPVISSEMFNELYGKVLTVVDATFADGSQKEAFKTLLKNELSGWYDKNTSYAFKMTEQAYSHRNDTEKE